MRRHLAAALLRASNADLWREFKSASANQWLSDAELDSLHQQRLGAVLRHAVAHVPRYREMAAELGWRANELTHESLRHFPLVDKVTMTTHRDAHIADDCSKSDQMKSETGGSSGVWFSFLLDRRTKEMRRAGDLLGRSWAGWRVGDAMALIWGHRGDVAATGSAKSRLVNALMHRRTVLNAYNMDDEAIAAYVSLLKRERPGLILGYASSLAFVAGYVARNGITGLEPKGIISSAEALSPERRAAISATFKCPVYDRYGSREFANIAQQCERIQGLHIFADRVHVEVLRPDGSECRPGERGEIVVTDFFNGAMPFIRYRTGDLGTYASKPCSCGRGLPLLESVEGRVTEIIVGPNGKYYACPGPMLLASDIPGIVQMQVVQNRISAIEVRVVPGPDWTDTSRGLLVARVRALLGEVEVSISIVDKILPAASGKYQFVISSVSPFKHLGSET